MELFAIFGISNAEILIGAASALVLALAVSLAVRAIRTDRSGVTSRVDRLELRLAAAEAVQPILNQADELVRQVSNHAVAPAIELFELAPRRRTFFGSGPLSHELAASLASELRDCLDVAAGMARPIRNMIGNGALEVAAERTKLAAHLREQAGGILSETWKEHRRAILSVGVPTRSVAALVKLFQCLRDLKHAVDKLDRKPSMDQVLDVLAAATRVLEAAEEANEIFAGSDRPAAA
jgi:hypothetical protein